jgi:hypothetical protein
MAPGSFLHLGLQGRHDRVSYQKLTLAGLLPVLRADLAGPHAHGLRDLLDG